jgi:exopolyphosphatase / guanosine-5'-triphosphate,3'-diphosphate pyrophosphatase
MGCDSFARRAAARSTFDRGTGEFVSTPIGVSAGIDIGTNSVRLLVLDGAGASLVRTATVTKLGAGLVNGRLHPDSITRTVAAVAGAVKAAAEQGLIVSTLNTRIIATSASRDATNGQEFLAELHRVSGVQPEVVSGDVEGALAWSGAMDSFEPRFTVNQNPELDALIDIGGGSTEFVIGHAGQAPIGVMSLDVGCVRMTEMFLQSDPPTAVELSSLISVVHAHLDDVEREMPLIQEATRFVGVAGSIVNVAAVELGRYSRDEIHRMWLTREAAEDVFRTLAQEPAVDRAFNPGLHPDRVGTVVAGAAILVTILRHFGLPGIWVSETDLLDAVARSIHPTQI